MILTFILGILAAIGAPYAEDRLREVLAQVPGFEGEIGPIDLRVVTLALLMLAAALIGAALGTALAVPLALGVVAGVIAPRLIDARNTRRHPDYDS